MNALAVAARDVHLVYHSQFLELCRVAFDLLLSQLMTTSGIDKPLACRPVLSATNQSIQCTPILKTREQLPNKKNDLK